MEGSVLRLRDGGSIGRPAGKAAAALVTAAALLTAVPVVTPVAGSFSAPARPAPRPRPPLAIVPPQANGPGGAALHHDAPLELLAPQPDRPGDDARSIALSADGPSAAADRDGSFWPDSSSPTRSAPSNATTGPAGPALPSFPGWNLAKVDLVVGPHQRYFLVARPTLVTASHLPVLLVLPGRNMTPATIARASAFLQLVGQAVVVFPAGFANSWNAGYCCGVAHLAGVDDVAFLERVVRTVLASQPGTSARQVYIAGFSNGGRMALDMACADPGAFAGVAAVEAVAVSNCLRTRPVPLLEVASTADPLLTVLAGAPPKRIAGHVEVTVQALVDQWRALDGCGPALRRTDYQRLSLTEWTSCRGGGRVEMAVYQGGRHAWPHGAPGTPAAQAVIWAFFHDTTPASRSDRPPTA